MGEVGEGESSSRRWLVPALAVVIASACLVAAFSSSWWTGGDQTVRHALALGKATLCHHGVCRARPLSELGIDATWGKAALALQLALVVVAAFVLLSAALATRAFGRRVAWASMMMTLFAAVLAVIVSVRLPFDGVAPGWSLIVGFVGLAGALTLSGTRVLVRPVDD